MTSKKYMMRKIYQISLLTFFLIFHGFSAQSQYFPEKEWVTKTPKELKMDGTLLDSAISFAEKAENKVNKDLRIAIIEAFFREPNFEILGPVKPRGGPAGMV